LGCHSSVPVEKLWKNWGEKGSPVVGRAAVTAEVA